MYDQADGDVVVRGYDGAGNEISLQVEDPAGSLLASNFSSADFLFVIDNRTCQSRVTSEALGKTAHISGCVSSKSSSPPKPCM